MTLSRTLPLRLSGKPPQASVTAEGIPTGTVFVAVVSDIQCCTHVGPCSPTEVLVANGVRLTQVVPLIAYVELRGLAFQVRGNGMIVQ